MNAQGFILLGIDISMRLSLVCNHFVLRYWDHGACIPPIVVFTDERICNANEVFIMLRLELLLLQIELLLELPMLTDNLIKVLFLHLIPRIQVNRLLSGIISGYLQLLVRQ